MSKCKHKWAKKRIPVGGGQCAYDEPSYITGVGCTLCGKTVDMKEYKYIAEIARLKEHIETLRELRELDAKDLAAAKAEVERLRAVLEGAGYQSIDNLKIESVEKCKSIGLTAKLLTEREITARVDMTTECGRLRTDLAAARKVIEGVREWMLESQFCSAPYCKKCVVKLEQLLEDK